jgi:hypothetical protein
MMDNFAQILQRLPTASCKHSGGATPFKAQVKFDIPIFDGQIDADVVDRWLNLLEGYFLVHDFFDREKIIFSLLKAAPHVKDWWETYCEKKDEEEPSLFSVVPTWNYFRDAIKEQYYPVGSYEDKYIQWTTLWQKRDQDVHELTNLFHTLRTNLGIKYSEKHLVMKYHSCLHIYIQEEMEFLNISLLGTTYWYAAKIEQKFKQKKRDFGSVNQKQAKGAPKLQRKGQSQGLVAQDSLPKPQEKNNTAKPKKDMGKWCEFHKISSHNTSECRAKQSLVAEMRAYESDACSNIESKPKKGMTEGSRLSIRSPTPPFPPRRSRGGGASLPLPDVGKGFPATFHC